MNKDFDRDHIENQLTGLNESIQNSKQDSFKKKAFSNSIYNTLANKTSKHIDTTQTKFTKGSYFFAKDLENNISNNETNFEIDRSLSYQKPADSQDQKMKSKGLPFGIKGNDLRNKRSTFSKNLSITEYKPPILMQKEKKIIYDENFLKYTHVIYYF